ncbi:hypothetical protein SAMD00019534_126100, partial [Acytostelium subglobosum LB1]|uniref:hypothetical protein n=1 Tax=Acytostelium subglobosum LB1 TaxID=1410327 RepID=UPI00064496DB
DRDIDRMIVHTDISFPLEFPVGKKYVSALFTLKKGEDSSVAVDQFSREYDIPPYLSVSLLNTIDTFLNINRQEYHDRQDEASIEGFPLSMIQSKTMTLAHQYTERTHYWNSMLPNEETAEQKFQEERIKMFLYLVNKSSESKEKIINQEELFATAFNILLSKRKEELQSITDSHSKLMQEAADEGAKDKIEELITDNVSKTDEVELRYQGEISAMKMKQKNDFTSFLNDLYWLETTKDELDKADEDLLVTTKPRSGSSSSRKGSNPPQPFHSRKQDQTTPSKESEKVSIIGSLGQGLDKGVQRASSFFSLDRFKKTVQQTPGQPQSSTPTSSSTSPSSTVGNNNNNNNNDVSSSSGASSLIGSITNTFSNSVSNSKPPRKESVGSTFSPAVRPAKQTAI